MLSNQEDGTKQKLKNITNLAIQRRRLQELDEILNREIPKNKRLEAILRKLRFFPCTVTEHERFYCDIELDDFDLGILYTIWHVGFELVKITTPADIRGLRMEIIKPK